MAPGASCGRPGLSCSLAYLLRNFTQRDSSGAVQFADYLRALCANINPYRESVTINGLDSNPRSTNSDPEIEKKGTLASPGDSLGEKRLAGAWGAHEQHARSPKADGVDGSRSRRCSAKVVLSRSTSLEPLRWRSRPSAST
jgi:hypothetical protein